jgi:hypothetical protein
LFIVLGSVLWIVYHPSPPPLSQTSPSIGANETQSKDFCLSTKAVLSGPLKGQETATSVDSDLEKASSTVPTESIADSVERPPVPQPLADLRGSEQENRILYEAEERAIAACMRQKGFDYVIDSYRSDAEIGVPAQNDPADLETAKWRGYGIADSIENGPIPVPDNANTEIFENLTPAQRQQWDQALSGPILPPFDPDIPEEDPNVVVISVPGAGALRWHKNSCYAQARRQIYGDEIAFAKLNLQRDLLRNLIILRITEDHDYIEALERWRTCMFQQGLSYEEPGQAAEALTAAYQNGEFDAVTLRQLEIEVATADVQCYREAILSRVRDKVHARIEEALRNERADTVNAWRKLHAYAVGRAQGLLDQ